MSGLVDVTEFHVPRILLTEALLHFRDVGRRGFEGFALWAGVCNGQSCEVTKTIIPEQRGIRNKSGVCVVIPPQELHRINVWLYDNHLTLVAQLHSHPTHAFHSEMDDDIPVATAVGSLSLVIPDFGRGVFCFKSAAVYRLSATAKWDHMSPTEAERLIQFRP